MLIRGDLIWWRRYHFSRASLDDQDEITTRGSIIREACENFSKYLKIPFELRPEQRQ